MILDSVGGDVLAQAASHLSVGGRLVSYGALPASQIPSRSHTPRCAAGNQTASGFSILRLVRTAPDHVTTLIRDTLALAADGLSIPAPEVIGWDDLIAAHLSQSEGRAVGKTVLAIQ